ncbi:MAG TPA: hypothetical protein PL160_06305 [Candidatus Cloacimonas sp.]|nr:hypothetical protein [Candidatus Cloacimonas sp.]
MTIRKYKLLLLFANLYLCLAGLEHIPDSAFAQPVKENFKTSLLNYPEPAKADSINVYGNGLNHPFTSIGRFGDAVLDAFRPGKARHCLVGYQSPDRLLKAEFNVLAGYEPVFAESLSAFFYKGFSLKSSLGRHWHFNTHWWNGMFFGSQSEAATSELIDGYNRPSNDRINLDNLKADLSYNGRNLTLAIGRGKFALGNSFSGSIILNDQVNDYAYLLAEGRSGDFSLSFMHGSLMADSSYSIYEYPTLNSKNYPDKYLAIHQLGYNPGDNLKLFLGEAVVYGNRSIDLNYLLPNAFWRATEHNLWDRDNVFLFAGTSFSPLERLFLYAQLALDEFSYRKLNTSWWGNKYALQGGMRYEFPLAFPDSALPTVGLEFTAVRPFTYTHYLNHAMYSHDGRCLGYPKGSNLVDLSASAFIPFQDQLSWQSVASYTRQGSFGSAWNQNYYDVFPGESLQNGTADWFQGDKAEILAVKSCILIDFLAHHRFLAGFEAEKRGAWNSHVFAAWQFVY